MPQTAPSYRVRRVSRVAPVAVALALLGGALLVAACGPERDPAARARAAAPAQEMAVARERRTPVVAGRRPTPSGRATMRARRYARGRAGVVAFALADTDGRLRCHECRRRYPSASLVKAMLLVADLGRLVRDGLGLTAADRNTLGRMVRESDNAAADVVYTRNGDAGLLRVARGARMRDFAPAGYWSEAQVSAADQARFFAGLTSALSRRHRAFGRNLLRTVVAAQSWGIPDAARPRWRTYFKGGWRPTVGGFLVHQAALLERGDRSLALAVLTDGNPSHEYGVQTVRGIAQRLLPRPR